MSELQIRRISRASEPRLSNDELMECRRCKETYEFQSDADGNTLASACLDQQMNESAMRLVRMHLGPKLDVARIDLPPSQ